MQEIIFAMYPTLPPLLASIMGGLVGGLAGAWWLSVQDRRSCNSTVKSNGELEREVARLRETEQRLLHDMTTHETIYKKFIDFICDR
ncbi:hypothetical protein HOY82DRAFT_607560 [Tuber indicum]|nr:hypothetical protein HOY82DRAFT_607560 [Tuber indicum]